MNPSDVPTVQTVAQTDMGMAFVTIDGSGTKIARRSAKQRRENDTRDSGVLWYNDYIIENSHPNAKQHTQRPRTLSATGVASGEPHTHFKEV